MSCGPAADEALEAAAGSSMQQYGEEEVPEMKCSCLTSLASTPDGNDGLVASADMVRDVKRIECCAGRMHSLLLPIVCSLRDLDHCHSFVKNVGFMHADR